MIKCEGPLIPDSKNYSIAAIYIWKNKQNGKIYIGSSNNVHKRYGSYIIFCRSSKTASRGIERALRLHGIENFNFYIVERVFDKALLMEREQWWLDILRPFEENGYNWLKTATHSERSIKGSPEYKLRRSQLSKEISLRTIEARTACLRKPVYKIHPTDLTILAEYPSAAEARRCHGGKWKIARACDCNTKSGIKYGFRWAYKEDYDKGLFVPYTYIRSVRPIKQFSLDGTLIKIWNSISEAARSVSANPCSLRACCEGRSTRSFGYKWEYVQNPGISQQPLLCSNPTSV